MTTLAELRKRAEAMHCPVRHGCGKGLHTHTMLKDKGYGCVLSDCPRAALLEAVSGVEATKRTQDYRIQMLEENSEWLKRKLSALTDAQEDG